MSYRGNKKGNYGNKIRKAKMVQDRRSYHAKAIDSSLKAPIAKNVDQWLNQPNRFDLPTVDTNKPKENKSYKLPESEYSYEKFDRLTNKDYVNDNPENKKAYAKILSTFDKAKIPYIIGEEDGIYVLRSDMAKAEKLTDKYHAILWKTSQ